MYKGFYSFVAKLSILALDEVVVLLKVMYN